MERAMFGAGCFWGVEAAFRKVPGVRETAVGYSGGDTVNPTYRTVCNGDTGHAEVVLVTFDPQQVSFAELLNVFWTNHDPTQRNRQGPDVGMQYRSGIYFYDEAQRQAAEASKTELQNSGRLRGKTIATEIVPAKEFYLAEDYHQQYLEKRGLASCHI